MQRLSKYQTFSELPEDYRECIDNFILNGNMTRSYELIHHEANSTQSNASMASRFFKKENIVKIIEERKQQLASVGSMEKQDIIRRIEDIAKGIAEDQFSDKTSIKDQLSALQMLCKINGIIDDKPQTNVTVQQIFVDDVRE